MLVLTIALLAGLLLLAGGSDRFVAGAAGTLTAVEGGTVTVKTPRGEETRRVDQMTAKQAIRYAGLGSDPRSKRMAAVLLLAEAETRREAAE